MKPTRETVVLSKFIVCFWGATYQLFLTSSMTEGYSCGVIHVWGTALHTRAYSLGSRHLKALGAQNNVTEPDGARVAFSCGMTENGGSSPEIAEWGRMRAGAARVGCSVDMPRRLLCGCFGQRARLCVICSLLIIAIRFLPWLNSCASPLQLSK